MKKIEKNKIIKYFKLILIILVILLVAFSQISQTSNTSNKLSPKYAWMLIIYIFGIIFIPVIAYCVSKLRKEKY